MYAKKPSPVLIGTIGALVLVLLLLIGVALAMSGCEIEPSETTAVPDTTLPIETTEATQATTEATQATTEATEATTQATTAPTTEPQPEEFVLSFVGDCCMANLRGKNSSSTFVKLVDNNFDWPFKMVQDYFGTDDCTFINLENVFTDYDVPSSKAYNFKAPPRFNAILTAGSVEFANVVNNHTDDYGKQGFADTVASLDAVGVHYAKEQQTTLFTTESGLTIGVYADSNPKPKDKDRDQKIAQLKADGAEVVVACFHWGTEYHYRPNKTQKAVARAAIDAGADIVYGHHSHVLQPIEEYNGKIIFYSLGNFSFGGNNNPPDRDGAILQQTVIRDVDGSISLGDLNIVPCRISNKTPGNDYQPVPWEPGSEGYERTLQKLNGTYPKTVLKVNYRDDLYPSDETTGPAETTVPGTTDGTTPPAESQPTETKPVETKPAETKPAETKPAETKPAETKPAETKPAETKPAATEAAPPVTQAPSDAE